MKKLYTILCLSLSTLSFAQNASVIFSNVTYSNVGRANYDYNFRGSDNSTGGLSISDARLVSTGLNDAYDGAFELVLSNLNAGVVGDTAYTNSLGAGSFSQIGNLYVNDVEKIDGINTSVSYFFKPENFMVAAIFKLANPAGTARSIAVKIATNLGSDGNTQLDSASTGGITAVNADRFTITSDGNTKIPGNWSGDPVNTFVRRGTGTVASSPYYLNTPGGGNDNIIDSFNVSIPANNYRYIVMFSRLDSTVAKAKEYAKLVKYNEGYVRTNGLLGATMVDAELLKVVNWDFASTITSVASNAVDLSYSLNAFPNPSTGLVTMNINNSMMGEFSMKITDNTGAEKQASKFSKNTEDMDLNLDLSSLPAGLYMVEIKQDNYIARKRISKF